MTATPVSESPVRTTRDDAQLRARLAAWLQDRLGPGSAPSISELSSPSGSGMSSETLLFDATWREDGAEAGGAFVARMAPSAADVPTFRRYDMAMQARVMQLAHAHGVPVPAVRWMETGSEALGAPFFVMERLEGQVPADIPPYLVDGWLKDASEQERRVLQTATVAAIAKIHSVDVASEDTAFLEYDAAGETPLRRHFEDQRDYHVWVAEGEPSPLIERAFACLEAHWPEETSTVLSWGDSRIGNVMYRGFEPVAILDWEMAGLGPRELDLGWLSFMHLFFQRLIEAAGLPGLPDLLRPEDVGVTYAEVSGHTPEDLHWYVTYAALRHAIIMTRISARSHHFGEGERAADPDDRFPHRATLEELLTRF